MSFRREQLAQIGGFDIRLGRIGACTLAGDEQDVCRALRRQPGGVRIVYNPSALVHHQISVESCTDAGLIKRSYCGGISNAVLDRKETAARRALALAVRPLKLALWLVRQLHHRASGLPPGPGADRAPARIRGLLQRARARLRSSLPGMPDVPAAPAAFLAVRFQIEMTIRTETRVVVMGLGSP